jgi:hypothetical protein
MNSPAPATSWAFWPTAPLLPGVIQVQGNAGYAPLPTPYWYGDLAGIKDPRAARKKAARLRAVAARLIAKGGKVRLKRAARLKARAARIERAAGLKPPVRTSLKSQLTKNTKHYSLPKTAAAAAAAAAEDDGDGEDPASDAEIAEAEADADAPDDPVSAEPSLAVSGGVIPGVSNTALIAGAAILLAAAAAVVVMRRRSKAAPRLTPPSASASSDAA